MHQHANDHLVNCTEKALGKKTIKHQLNNKFKKYVAQKFSILMNQRTNEGMNNRTTEDVDNDMMDG